MPPLSQRRRRYERAGMLLASSLRRFWVCTLARDRCSCSWHPRHRLLRRGSRDTRISRACASGTRTVAVAACRLYCSIANTGNADSWQYNIPGFVEAGYRVVTFDRRGWGRSTANPDTGPQPGTIAEDLHALVEYLKLDRFHLVGVAGGGFAAYDYILWHPERVRSWSSPPAAAPSSTKNCGSSAKRRPFPGLPAGPRSFGK